MYLNIKYLMSKVNNTPFFLMEQILHNLRLMIYFLKENSFTLTKANKQLQKFICFEGTLRFQVLICF